MTGVVNISLAFVLRRPTPTCPVLYTLYVTPPSKAGSRIFIANAAQLSVKKIVRFAVSVDSPLPPFVGFHGGIRYAFWRFRGFT